MNYYDDNLLMQHLNSLREDSGIQTIYSSQIHNALNSAYFNIDGSLKLKHKYNTPKIDLRSIMDSVSSTTVQYTPNDVEADLKMYAIWLEHEQAMEEESKA